MIIYSMDVTIPTMETFFPRVSEERLENIKRFRFEIDKRRGLGAEALLNYGLKKLCPELETPVTLVRDDNGKPHVILSEIDRGLCVQKELLQDENDEIVFSLSHSGNYAVCAIADNGEHAVGVDIEQKKRDPGKIAEHFFCASEIAQIKDDEDFYIYWTLKESFIKAVGLGLKLPLDSFEVIIEDDGISAEYRQNIDNEERYYGRVYRQFEGYTVSACCGGGRICFPEKIEEVFSYSAIMRRP